MDIATPSYPQLQLLSFKWDNGQDFTISFSEGLTILHGRNQAFRTIVLRLIRYAMGGSAERIDEEIMQTSTSVELEFTANDELIRTVRSCKHPNAQLDVFGTQYHRLLTPSEMSRFMLEKLDIPRVFMQRTRQGKREEVPISFNDLARAIVVDRDISYSGILSEVPPQARNEIMKLLMGLTTKEIADTENRLRVLENQYKQLVQRIENIRSFLSDVNVPSLMEIESRRRTLSETLSELDNEERNLREIVRERTVSRSPISGDRSQYETRRSELIQKRDQLGTFERERLNLLNQQQEKRDLRALLETEANRISRILASQHVVSTYTFSQCPRCLQAITQNMRDREFHGDCMLCGRPINTRTSDDKAWRKALSDAKQTIKEVDQLLGNYSNRLDELEHNIPVLNERIQQLEQALTHETSNYVSPLVEQIRLSVNERTNVERELSQLDYQERQRNYANHLDEVTLPQEEQQLERFNRTLSLLRSELGTSSEKYNAFLAHFRHFLRHVQMVSPVHAVSWDEREQLPLINRQAYKKAVTGPDLAITVLAFHYGLLAMSVAEPEVRTSHPKLLIIDEPEQQKMGKERYGQVMTLFGELAQEYTEQVQIIIATDTRDIPSAFEQHALLI